ncbi:alpha/beta fold hydrolase [Salinicoccus hispanicus]|uniref:Alpha/beta fold hydrolase n=1 Tax=Salinicoccus hispanicus TaxID=157225 RepID=A0A6N8TYL6_9STAP|nr:alpha/beta hydrolase [Salinicoccus hispanicus]MXQ50117.1 alpha/beta fold hydrolase [Salinicoccus hispanicus]
MFESTVINTSRGQFEVFKRGHGEPLAFTHLYSEFNQNGNTMARALAEYYTVYIINLRGAGGSDGPTETYTYSMDDAIHDMEAIRETLGFEEWTFSGHSTGGFLALKYAVMYPDKLNKIIAGGLCASYEYMDHPDSIYCADNPNNSRMKEIFSELRKPDTPRETRIEIAKEWIMMSLYRKEAYYDLLERKESGRTLMDKIDYFTAELNEYDVREELKKTPVEAFIYSGRHDAQCPYIFSKEAADLMPNGSLTTFEFSNHNPDIEEEEKFNAFIKETANE